MTNPEQNAGIPEIVEGHHIAGPVGGVATGTEVQVEPAALKPKRVAVPPDFIGGPLSSENAA